MSEVLEEAIGRRGWSLAGGLPPLPDNGLDAALVCALALAGVARPVDLAPQRRSLYVEGRRRLFPSRFAPVEGELADVAAHFFPLAAAIVDAQGRSGGAAIAERLPFRPLDEEEIVGWASEDEYRRLLRSVDDDGLLVTMAMAQQWLGFSIADHVLGVTGLSLWIGRQVARRVPVSLPLLHGAAIGHDVGKFGCIGDEERRIPRLHYYYTHVWYQDRRLPGLGHIATNHSCWDLERVRLPVETQLLVYADFRVKDAPGPDGRPRMSVISLRDSYATIRDKLENVDSEKLKRYRGVYRKLRDLEDYLLTLGVDLNPEGFVAKEPDAPSLPRGLDVVEVMAGGQRPDVVALATGGQVATVARLFSTAHNIGVMERLRNQPSLRALLEEARSSEGWRDLRTYIGILGEYSPAMSMEQKALAVDFFYELLTHRDDDVRYHAANRIGDLLALEEEYWTKDLPEGVDAEESSWAVREIDRVMALLDEAGLEPEEDMGPTERKLYAVPLILRRMVRSAEGEPRAEAIDRILELCESRIGDHRPLVGLYVCETFEVLLPQIPSDRLNELIQIAQGWYHHDIANTRIMAWRLLLGVARVGKDVPGVKEGLRYCVDLLAPRLQGDTLVAELFLLEELALLADATRLAEQCREIREGMRSSVREVMLRNLKARVGWVEKKVNCDYLTALALERVESGSDPEAHFAHDVAFHLANLLKVSRVEGTRFHAGRSLLRLLPVLSVPQHNDLAVELLRSLQLDVEAVARYIPRFLGQVISTLPEQEFEEIVDDIAVDLRRGAEPLQRLLLQTVGWIVLTMGRVQSERSLRRLAGMLLGALAESRASTVHEALAQLAMVLDRLTRKPLDPKRLPELLRIATKKFLSLITHKAGERGRFFLVASALNHLDRALHQSRPRVKFAEKPSVGLIPGTFDPFTTAHAEVVERALMRLDEVLVQVDDYSWRKHAQPRDVRQELAWMALAPLPDAFLSPLDPPVNIANAASMKSLRRRVGRRELTLVVGTDVLEGASAYRDAASHIWDLPHLVVSRESHPSRAWQSKLGWFRAGIQVARVSNRAGAVSSTSLRDALKRQEDLETFCEPLLARILRERQLYLNFPSAKTPVSPPELDLEVRRGDAPLPLPVVVTVDAFSPAGRRTMGRLERCLLRYRSNGRPVSGLSWREVPAAELPVVVKDRDLTEHLHGDLVGLGALVEEFGASEDGAEVATLLARVMARWMDEGLLFALFGLPARGAEDVTAPVREAGARWITTAGENGRRWAALSLTDPLVMVWDLESVLQPPFAAAPAARQVIGDGRRDLSRFFAERFPGHALLHLHEREIKRQVVEWAVERISAEDRPWVLLGLGNIFSRDVVSSVPTIALEFERFLTWEGYEAGFLPSPGSPSLELQLHTARELGRDAMLMAPVVAVADPVLQAVDAAKAAGIRLREVLVGVTSASVHATLHLRGIPHRCGAIVPRWRGLLRESALCPYIGGWSIVGREQLAIGSLLPSLNDCLPYHDPHPVGLDREGALDFSRLALGHAGRMLEVLEELFRAAEGRLMSIRDLAAVVRVPRCPPTPEGFLPPSDRLPSHLLAEDLRALARLHPESHAAHRERWGIG